MPFPITLFCPQADPPQNERKKDKKMSSQINIIGEKTTLDMIEPNYFVAELLITDS